MRGRLPYNIPMVPRPRQPQQDGEGAHLWEPWDSFLEFQASSEGESTHECGGSPRNVDEGPKLIPFGSYLLSEGFYRGQRTEESFVGQASDGDGSCGSEFDLSALLQLPEGYADGLMLFPELGPDHGNEPPLKAVSQEDVPLGGHDNPLAQIQHRKLAQDAASGLDDAEPQEAYAYSSGGGVADEFGSFPPPSSRHDQDAMATAGQNIPWNAGLGQQGTGSVYVQGPQCMFAAALAPQAGHGVYGGQPGGAQLQDDGDCLTLFPELDPDQGNWLTPTAASQEDGVRVLSGGHDNPPAQSEQTLKLAWDPEPAFHDAEPQDAYAYSSGGGVPDQIGSSSPPPTRHDEDAMAAAAGQNIPWNAGVRQQYGVPAAGLAPQPGRGVHGGQLQASSAAARQRVVPASSEERRPQKRGRKSRAAAFRKPPTVERQPIPLPQDLRDLPDQSYHLREDLEIIVAVRACLDAKAPTLVPYRPDMVATKVAELQNAGLIRVDMDQDLAEDDSIGHGLGLHSRTLRWSCQATNPLEKWIPEESTWLSKQYYIGEYTNRLEACRATDRLKLKMNLCGYYKRETFNFPPEDYIAEMTSTDVQFIRHHSFYCEHVLMVKRQQDEQGVEEVEHPYRGVYRQKQASRQLFKFVSRLLLRCKKGKWIVPGRADSPTEAAMIYDRLLITEGLFVNPGARHHIPNFPLGLYQSEIMDFVQGQVPHLSSRRPEALDRLTRAFSMASSSSGASSSSTDRSASS